MKTFGKGFRDGIPIGLGYFAVAFSLGIVARNVGMTALQGFIASFLTIASAGEYAAFNAIGEHATYLAMAAVILVTNARYLLMSCAMSQRLDPKMHPFHRIGMGFFITDEIFGASIAQEGYLKPAYTYGAAAASVPLWALGTSFGVIMGNLLPDRIVVALSVSLYGMFIAIIVPAAKKDKIVFASVVISFLCSIATRYISIFDNMSESFRVIILTVVIAGAFALLFPVKDEEETQNG